MGDNPFKPMHAADAEEDAIPQRSEQEQQEAEAGIESAVDQALASDNPEASLQALLDQLPPEMHDMARKRFNKKRREQEAEQSYGSSIRDIYEQLKQKLSRILAPNVMDQVKSVGLELNAKGINLNSVENIEPGRVGQLSPPSIGAGVTQEQEVER